MPKIHKLSIVIPCYNEEATIQNILAEIEAVDLGDIKKEIVIVDDGSKDSTRDILKKFEKKAEYKILYQPHNQGKGAAVKRGMLESTGDAIVIQDADLEYDPQDFKKLLYPLEHGQADVVYGSRFIGGEPYRIAYRRNKVANKVLTHLSNIFTGLDLSDVHTCYKMILGDVGRELAKDLKVQGFGFDPELTARIAKKNLRICEVGISYYGRSKEEGKKIGYSDGFKAIWENVYYNLSVKRDK